MLAIVESTALLLIPFLFWGGFCCFGVLTFAFWIWMLIDCIQYEKSEGNDKLIWVLVIIFTGWIGALIYFFVRRTNRPDRRGTGRL